MKATILAAIVLAFSTSHALAVSLSVKLACKDDYFAHCSHHAVGTPGVRKCMRDVGPRLSSRCIGALADAGMIKSKAVTKKYASKKATKTQVAEKPAVRMKYAKKPAAKTRIASKRSQKQRYANKPSKQRITKSERARYVSGRRDVAYVQH